MKKIIATLAILTALSIASIANAMQNPTCPFDDSSAYWTGKTEFIEAHMFRVYKCVRGHQFLVRQN